MLGGQAQSVIMRPMLCCGGGIGRMSCGTLRILECTQCFFGKIFAIKHVVLVGEPLNKSKHCKNRWCLLLMCAQNNHVTLRDTPIHTYTLTHNHSTTKGSGTIIPVA